MGIKHTSPCASNIHRGPTNGNDDENIANVTLGRQHCGHHGLNDCPSKDSGIQMKPVMIFFGGSGGGGRGGGEGQHGPGDWIVYLDYTDCKQELHRSIRPPPPFHFGWFFFEGMGAPCRHKNGLTRIDMYIAQCRRLSRTLPLPH